jgi:Tol biopolymer transport system component
VTRRSLVLVGVAGIAAAALALAVVLLVADRGPSPGEGDVIAFSCREPNNLWFAVCASKVDGSQRRRLTSRLPTSEPDWSPDGRRIAFTRNEDVGESTTFTDDDVFVMTADGDDQRQLTPEQVGSMSLQPTWSADGRELAFVRGESVASAVPSRFGDLYVISVEDGDARRVARGPLNDPDWSPDGHEVIYTRGSDLATIGASMDLFVLDLTSGDERRLTATPDVFESAAAWSPDGERIAFARWTNRTQYDGKAALHVMERDGTGERLLLAHTHFASGPAKLAWSPDGTTIAFETSSVIGCTSISLLVVATGAVRPVTACAKPIESTLAPAWQPDATREDR